MLDRIKLFIEGAFDRKSRFDNVMDLLNSVGGCSIAYNDGCKNLVSKGYSNVYLVAHYDVVDYNYCYLDNTVSLFIAVELKKRFKDLNIIFTDKEEPPYFGKGIKSMVNGLDELGYYINLEVLGGGSEVVYDKRFSNIYDVVNFFRGISMPFSDGVILFNNGFNVTTLASVCDYRVCHSSGDNCDAVKDEFIYSNIDCISKFVDYLLSI